MVKDGADDFIRKYLTVNNETFTDPSGTDYNLNHRKQCSKNSCTLEDANNVFASGDIYVYQYATCNGDDIQYKNSNGSYAFVMKLRVREESAQTPRQCLCSHTEKSFLTVLFFGIYILSLF